MDQKNHMCNPRDTKTLHCSCLLNLKCLVISCHLSYPRNSYRSAPTMVSEDTSLAEKSELIQCSLMLA